MFSVLHCSEDEQESYFGKLNAEFQTINLH